MTLRRERRVIMTLEKITRRNIVFKFQNVSEWDLNIHLIMGDKYNYIIDTGLGSLSMAPVIEYLKGYHNPIIIINTHHHWDHVWGNHIFSDCAIVSHRLCREKLEMKWDDMLQKNKRFMDGDVQRSLPNMVFEDTLYFPDDHIRLFFTPGHTADCISVLDETERVLNVGDNIGDTLDEIVPELETEKAVYLNTLLQYKARDFNICVSGHNIVLGKDIIDTVIENIVS